MITKLQVKYIQSLGQKKFRDEEGLFVAEGPKIINELLAAQPGSLSALYAVPEWLHAHTDLTRNFSGDIITTVKDAELMRISFQQTPHEVLAVFKKPPVPPMHLRGVVSLMLDGIQDPGNMGTIIRTADWFGVHQIVCSKDCADAFAPKVVQGSMGSIMRVQLLYTNLEELVIKTPGLPLYAATLNGLPVTGMSALKEGMIVIGNESKGIHPALLEHCQHRVTIPKIGQAESLNAAVATGILLSKLKL